MPYPNEEQEHLELAQGVQKPTMDELLKASDYSQPQPAEEREWVDAPSAGGELI